MEFQKQYLLQNVKHVNLHKIAKSLMSRYQSKTGTPIQFVLSDHSCRADEPEWFFSLLNYSFKGIVVKRLKKNRLIVSLETEATETDARLLFDFIAQVKETNKQSRILDLASKLIVNLSEEEINAFCQSQRQWMEDQLNSEDKTLIRIDNDSFVQYEYLLEVLKKTNPNSSLSELVDEMQKGLIEKPATDPMPIPDKEVIEGGYRLFIMKWDPELSNFKEEDFQRTLDKVEFGAIGSWGVTEYEKVRIGDYMALLRMKGENPGIVWMGEIITKPVKDADFIDPFKEKWFVKFRMEAIVNQTDENMLTLDQLKELAPDINWETCPNGIALTEEQKDSFFSDIDLYGYMLLPQYDEEEVSNVSKPRGKSIFNLVKKRHRRTTQKFI